jgi:CHRD domain
MTIRRFVTAIVVCAGFTVFGHSAASAQGLALFAVLVGGNEVSTGGDANAGDTNAYGSATIIFRGTNTLCWAILVNNLDTPTAAHIHSAKAGVNGPITVTLAPPANDADAPFANPGTASGCITDASAGFATIIRNLKANPSVFYINIHSINFAGGGVRGQLF